MKCRDARKINYLTEYPHVVTEDMFEAKRHINECRECRKFFEGENAFGSMLRQKIIKDKLTAELRQKILTVPKEHTKS